MAETHLLQDLAIVMVVAATMTLICHYLRQPVVLGYLLAGLIIGPFTPPFSFVSDIQSIHTMAELGLVFLMFSLGLEFNLPKLKRVGLSAALAAMLEVLGMWGIGYALGRFFDWNRTDSVFLGAILSISSTTIIVKVFMDLKLMKEEFAQAVFGILILEDIVAVLILSVLSGLSASGGAAASLFVAAMWKIGFFVILFLILGLLIVPRFIHWVAHFQTEEMLGIVTLGLCLCGALLASLFGFSVALGAFLAGAVIAASEEIEPIEKWIHPVRDMFSAIFFVSAGMLIQPGLLWKYKGPILIVTLVTLAGKILSGSVGSFLAGYKLKTSFKIGMSLAQIGEFSFVIASLGAASKMTSDFLYPLAVAVSSLTTLSTPYLIRSSDSLVEKLLRVAPGPFQRALNRYQSWMAGRVSRGPTPGETRVLSKYLVRLVMYIVMWISLLLVCRGLSRLVPQGVFPFLLWTACAVFCLPLFAATAKYGNHLLLLAVTRIPLVLRFINIRHFYNVMLSVFFGILGAGFLLAARSSLPSPVQLGTLAFPVFLAGLLARKKVSAAAERMEELLDEAIGLATSEPTRQALLKAEKTAFLHGVMEPFALVENSPALEKNLRSLRLREQTGVSVVAVYRDGQHIANPSPDTTLRCNDILMVIGSEEERRKAKEILLGADASA